MSPVAGTGRGFQVDPLLPALDTGQLKQIARTYVGKSGAQLRKDDAIRAIRAALQDPTRLRGLYPGFTDAERYALYLLQRAGGAMHMSELAGVLWASGHVFPERTRSHSPFTAPVDALLTRGLIFYGSGYGRYYLGDTYGLDDPCRRAIILADERLLAFATPRAPVDLELAPAPAPDPETTCSRRPAEVVLGFSHGAQALSDLGSLALLRSGELSKAAATKWCRAIGNPEPVPGNVALPLRKEGYPNVLLSMLRAAGAAVPNEYERALHVDPSVWARLQESFPTQLAFWAHAYQQSTGWTEYLPPRSYGSSGGVYDKFNVFRAILLTVLTAIPDPAGWYRFADLFEAIRPRFQRQFSLRSILSPYYYRATAADSAEAKEEQRKKLQENWDEADAPWLQLALRVPLFQLGLVELGGSAQSLETLLFRLTEPARLGIWQAARQGNAGVPVSDADSPPCWIVQPNMDVVVYLDRVTAGRLSLLGRVGELQSRDRNAAVYRLTRESVYRGLEGGLPVSELTEGLARGSERPLPDSVRRSLQDWSARRERIRVAEWARLLEFPNTAERDAAAKKCGMEDAAIGERFLRLTAGPLPEALRSRVGLRIDYFSPPERNLRVAEDGSVMVTTAPDLVLRGILSRWADAAPNGPNQWRITEASVRRAVSQRSPVRELETALEQRGASPTPPLLLVGIRAWANGKASSGVSLSRKIVLQIEDLALAEAIRTSAVLKPHLGAEIGPQAFLVDEEQAGPLEALLKSYGVTPAVATDASQQEDPSPAVATPPRRGRPKKSG